MKLILGKTRLKTEEEHCLDKEHFPRSSRSPLLLLYTEEP
jgi:hypothetical protein